MNYSKIKKKLSENKQKVLAGVLVVVSLGLVGFLAGYLAKANNNTQILESKIQTLESKIQTLESNEYYEIGQKIEVLKNKLMANGIILGEEMPDNPGFYELLVLNGEFKDVNSEEFDRANLRRIQFTYNTDSITYKIHQPGGNVYSSTVSWDDWNTDEIIEEIIEYRSSN